MIQPKFEIGQRVFCVTVGWFEEKVKCPDCLGEKAWTVTTPAGEVWKHDCNTCRNGWYCTGLVSEYADRAHIKELTVGSIRIDTADKESPVAYMCEETGIGSGTIHYEKTLHATKEDADTYAAQELERVKGMRQAEELKQRSHKKRDSIYKRA